MIPKSYVAFKKRVLEEIPEAKVYRNFRSWTVDSLLNEGHLISHYDFTDMDKFIRGIKEFKDPDTMLAARDK